ncbi:unnamed protein product, partial [Mesorhabditis spiculigera]
MLSAALFLFILLRGGQEEVIFGINNALASIPEGIKGENSKSIEVAVALHPDPGSLEDLIPVLSQEIELEKPEVSVGCHDIVSVQTPKNVYTRQMFLDDVEKTIAFARTQAVSEDVLREFESALHIAKKLGTSSYLDGLWMSMTSRYSWIDVTKETIVWSCQKGIWVAQWLMPSHYFVIIPLVGHTVLVILFTCLNLSAFGLIQSVAEIFLWIVLWLKKAMASVQLKKQAMQVREYAN